MSNSGFALSIFRFYGKRFLTIIAVILCAALSLPAVAEFYAKAGYVLARGSVLGPNGQPILVVVGEQGALSQAEELEEIGEQVGALEGSIIMSGDAYRQAVKAYREFVQQDAGGLARGHCIVHIDNYGAEHCGEASVRVPAATPGAVPETKNIVYPPLPNPEKVKSVVLRHSSTILNPDQLGPTGPVLLTSPIDLRNIDTAVAPPGPLDPGGTAGDSGCTPGVICSVLLNSKGRVLYKKEHNITYRWGYFQPAVIDGRELDENQQSQFGVEPDRERILNPIAGAKVKHAIDIEGRFTVTSSDEGRFFIHYYLPPCPCFSFPYDATIGAEVAYRNFNPKSKDVNPFLTFYASRPVSDFCSGYHQCPGGASIIGQMSKIEAIAIHSTMSSPGIRADIKVDAFMITGQARLVNANGAPVSVGQTGYSSESQAYDPANPENPNTLEYDFDADRRPDRAVLYNGEYYVYLGGRQPQFSESNPQQPIGEDLRRRPDQLNDFQNRGLLESISAEDLQQTDLYVFRVSTGELIVEREGLQPQEYARGVSGGVNESDGTIFYKQLIRGPRAIDAIGELLSDWWSKAGMKQELAGTNRTDHLRFGEKVQIILINRPTGYIGSQIAEIKLQQNGVMTGLDIPIGLIELRPPNLRIRAERQTTTQLGLTAGEINQYLIGSEGSGLVSDTYIKITTDWSDQDGTPLPDALPGYSATLAKIVGAGELAQDQACGSAVHAIDIKPGVHPQLLKLQESCDLNTEHYYLYVCGHQASDTARDKCYDFDGPTGRPNYYVPVKVPVFDEIATRSLENTFQYARQDDLLPEDAQRPEPVYQWFYRPEMQFSVFELDEQNLRLRYQDPEDNTQVINLAEASPETISELFSGEIPLVNVLYSLFGPDDDVLQSFAPERELIFAIGDREVLITVQADGTLVLNDLDRFIAFNPEDFLALRIYQNSDPANILWQYAINARVFMHSLSQVGQEDEALASLNPAITTGTGGSDATGWAELFEMLLPQSAMAQADFPPADILRGQIFKGTFRDDFFYPELGNKKIFVMGSYPDGETYGEEDKVSFIGAYAGNEKIGRIEVQGSEGPVSSFKDGFAKFVILGGHDRNISPLKDEQGNDQRIVLKFRVETARDGKSEEIPNPPGIFIKNNSNTSLAEVLSGEGVFVYDTTDDSSLEMNEYTHTGRSYGVDENGQKVATGGTLPVSAQYLDYVQYMMNMVTIPLRTPVRESNLAYVIENPNGIYNDVTENLLKALMTGESTLIRSGLTLDLAIDKDVISHEEQVEPEFPVMKTEGGFIVHLGSNKLPVIYTFEKLLQDYQDNTVTTNIKEELVQDFQTVPRLSADTYRYRIITPEVMRGLDTANIAESGLAIAANGSFNDQTMGIYHLYRHYDWDGDGASNLAEVENNNRHITPNAVFNPLISTTNAHTLAYSRGYIGISTNLANNGRGEIAQVVGEGDNVIAEVVDGMRLPNFGVGYYYYPSTDTRATVNGITIDRDNYTILNVLKKVEILARIWSAKYPDTYPLITGLMGNELNNSLTGNGPDDLAGGSGRNEPSLRIGIGDFSPRGGGENKRSTSICGQPTCIPGQEPNYSARRQQRNIEYFVLDHQGHENGLEVDFRYVRNDGREGMVLASDAANYDHAKTVELINDMASLGAILIFTSSDQIIASFQGRTDILVTEQEDHDNHGHVRFPMTDPIATGQTLTAKTVNLSDANTMEITIRDTKGISMPQHTAVYLQEASGAQYFNLESSLVRTDGNGVIQIRILPGSSPVTADTSASFRLYRPDEKINTAGASIVEGNLIGTQEFTITFVSNN